MALCTYLACPVTCVVDRIGHGNVLTHMEPSQC